MDIGELTRRTAPRVQAIVCRGPRVLTVEHDLEGERYGCLPGGALDIDGQEPVLGHDPELDEDELILVDIRWKALWEIPERDRAFLWEAGLLSVEGLHEEAADWGDDVSYPG